MKENFEVQLLTWHKEGAGLIENVHNLDAKAWKQVEVVTIDIALDKKNLSANDYKEETDPRCHFNFIDFTFYFTFFIIKPFLYFFNDSVSDFINMSHPAVVPYLQHG